ncbi:unnamed protein product, partial [Prorocentrum cordatum]
IDAKSRIVGIGYNGPDIVTLRCDAPTLTGTAFYILLQTVASWNCSLFGGDAFTAFLQADQTKAQREKPIYLRQPAEGSPGVQRGVLLLVQRAIVAIYGVMNSSVLLYNTSGRLTTVIGIHVNDLIGGAGAKDGGQPFASIRQRFIFGKWRDDELTYCGRHITKIKNGQILINQKEFCSQCFPAPLPRWRRIEEKTNFA